MHEHIFMATLAKPIPLLRLLFTFVVPIHKAKYLDNLVILSLVESLKNLKPQTLYLSVKTKK